MVEQYFIAVIVKDRPLTESGFELLSDGYRSGMGLVGHASVALLKATPDGELELQRSAGLVPDTLLSPSTNRGFPYNSAFRKNALCPDRTGYVLTFRDGVDYST